jgi:hypothetical protein
MRDRKWLAIVLTATLLWVCSARAADPAGPAGTDVADDEAVPVAAPAQLITDARIDGDKHVDAGDDAAALLSYGSSFFLLRGVPEDADIYWRVGRVHERLGLRHDSSLERAERMFGPDFCLRGGPPSDLERRKTWLACLEGLAATQLRLKKRDLALAALADLRRAAPTDPGTDALLAFVEAIASIRLGPELRDARAAAQALATVQEIGNPSPGTDTAPAAPAGPVPPWMAELARLATAPEGSFAIPVASSLVAMFVLGSEPGRIEPGCDAKDVDKARYWAGRSSRVDAIRYFVQGRLAECNRARGAALAAYRLSLATPLQLLGDREREWARAQHPSLLAFLTWAEDELAPFILARADAGARRMLAPGVPAALPRVSVDVVVTPRVATRSGVAEVAAETGPADAAVPIAITGTVETRTWLDTFDVDVSPRPDGVTVEAVRLVHLQRDPAALARDPDAPDCRRFYVRLALPPRDDGQYAVVVRATAVGGAEAASLPVDVPRVLRRHIVHDLPNVQEAKRRALLVGVGKYQDDTGTITKDPELRNLEFAPRDVFAVRRLLTNPLRAGPEAFDFTHIDVLPQDPKAGEVSLKDFKRRLTSLVDYSVTERDSGSGKDVVKPHVYRDQLTLFYFSGHGQTRKTNTQVWDPVAKEDLKRPEACLLLSDAEAASCDDPAAYTPAELRALLERLVVRGVVMIHDFCYSSQAQLVAPSLWTYARDRDRGTGAVSLAASAAVAFEVTAFEQGLLTAALLEGLRGKADDDGNRDGRVSVLELWSFAQRRLAKIHTLFQNAVIPAQVPALSSVEWREEVILVDNKRINRLRAALTGAARRKPLSAAQVRTAARLLGWDPEPTAWAEVLDVHVLQALANDRLGYDDFLGLLSRANRDFLRASAP